MVIIISVLVLTYMQATKMYLKRIFFFLISRIYHVVDIY